MESIGLRTALCRFKVHRRQSISTTNDCCSPYRSTPLAQGTKIMVCRYGDDTFEGGERTGSTVQARFLVLRVFRIPSAATVLGWASPRKCCSWRTATASPTRPADGVAVSTCCRGLKDLAPSPQTSTSGWKHGCSLPRYVD